MSGVKRLVSTWVSIYRYTVKRVCTWMWASKILQRSLNDYVHLWRRTIMLTQLFLGSIQCQSYSKTPRHWPCHLPRSHSWSFCSRYKIVVTTWATLFLSFPRCCTKAVDTAIASENPGTAVGKHYGEFVLFCTLEEMFVRLHFSILGWTHIVREVIAGLVLGQIVSNWVIGGESRFQLVQVRSR